MTLPIKKPNFKQSKLNTTSQPGNNPKSGQTAESIARETGYMAQLKRASERFVMPPKGKY